MTEQEIKQLLAIRLEQEEGRRNKPYTDTVGKTTIGVGRNLTDNGLRDDEIQLMLSNDIDEAYRQCEKSFSWFSEQPGRAKIVLVDMCFNIGIGLLKGFKNMLGYFERKMYTSAASELLSSKYAKQVGKRADNLAELLLTL